MSFYMKLICTLILISHVMCRRGSGVFNPCLFNVFTKFYISENVYFDLSRFASEHEEWVLRYTHDNYQEADLKFTFCQNQRLNSYSLCSDSSALACIFTTISDTETYLVKNAGSRISGPFYRNGELQISIDNGDRYRDIRFSVLVKLNCSDIEEKPRFVSYHDFAVTVLWDTPVGCPIDENDIQNPCVISSPNGVKYNLRPLRHSLYHYDHKKGHYRVNICGKKEKDECNTVCEYDELKQEVGEFGTVSQLALTGAKYSDLVIRYLSHSDDIRAEVFLKCDRGSEPHITRISSGPGHVHIYMNTIFACEPAHPHTIFQNVEKNSYNISALYHNAHNYIVKGPTEDLNYIFNLGGTVDHMPGIACEGAICLWDSHNNLSVSLGHAQLEPIANGDYIQLKFTGGDRCGIGSNVHRAVIKLRCNLPGGDPEYEFSTHDCIHYIVWETQSACYYKYFKGSQCTISEETYSHFYNLNPLYKSTNNYVAVSPKNEKFYINICGSIVGRNCGSFESSGVSVCWNNKAIGHINTEPIYYNGGIELKMTGQACRRNGPNSTVTIKFLCEMDIHAEDHNKIELEGKDEFYCVFIFIMYTSTVCASAMKKFTCLVTDSQLGYEYDFKKLSRTNSNYVVKNMAKGSNSTFLLNVCQPVISGPNVMCPPDAMACIVNDPFADNNRYSSIGKMSDNSFKINKEHNIELHYTEGIICMDNTDTSGDETPQHMDRHITYETSTVIEFICDHLAKDSEPKFDSLHKCVYRFIWLTPVACPLDSQEVTQQTSKIHEGSKENVLPKDVPDHSIKTEEKENITPLELTFDHEKNRAGVSSEKEQMESRYIYEESSPEHSVDYMSHAIKLKNVPDCFAMDNRGERIDLSALMRKEWHVVIPPGKNLVFSVCHNLIFAKCSSNRPAGSCMNKVNTGIANNRLIYQPGQPGMLGKVILNYTGGDACNSTHNYSTLLLFECGIEDKLPTLLTMTDDCAIVIKFETPLVCVLDCVAHSIDMKISIDLNAFKSSTHNYLVKNGEDEFLINVCRPLVVTNHRLLWPDGTAACKYIKKYDSQRYVSLGYLNTGSSLIVDKTGSVWLHYVFGSRCPNHSSSFSSVMIHFICSTTEGFGHPVFHKETDECEYYFEWHTSIVCTHRTEVFDSDTCLIHDTNFTSIMNLTDFKESRREVRSLTGPIYMLELCRNTMKICNNSHICRKSGQKFVDYGNTPITTYDYARNAIHILYAGEECSPNARFHASIWLKCNRSHSWSSPSITKETECIVVFEWQSKHFCYYPNTSTGALMLSNSSYENNTSTDSAGLFWIIVGLFTSCMIAFAFGLWLMDRGNSKLVDLLRYFCTSTPPTTRIRYSRNSEESSSIL